MPKEPASASRDVFGQQHSLRRRQHNIFGGRAVWPTPLPVPNSDPFPDTIGNARPDPLNIARTISHPIANAMLRACIIASINDTSLTDHL
jgi:hypothetical protein